MNSSMIGSPSEISPAPTARDAMRFLRRRRGLFLSIAVPILFGAVVLAFKLPPVYQSQLRIRIEQPAIPDDSRTPQIKIEERIQQVSQSVLAIENVLPIIDEFDLYSDERQSAGDQLAVDLFRGDTYIENISTEIFDSRRGRIEGSTFAFIVGYRTVDPLIAQSVTAKLGQLYVDENIKSRTEKSAERTKFLEEQADRISAEISRIEVRLAEFKSQDAGALPDRQYLNVQALDRTDRELGVIEQTIRTLRNERNLLQGELQSINPHTTLIDLEGTPVLSVEERLAALQLELTRLESIYGDEYPDIIRIKREIQAILGGGSIQSRDKLEQQLKALRRQRDELLERYSVDHPDVQQVLRSIERLELRLAEIEANPSSSRAVQSPPNNPLYIQKQLMIDNNAVSQNAAQRSRTRLLARRTELEHNIAIAPRVEKELLELNRGYDSAREEFDEIRAEISQAKISESRELQNKGESFTLMENASLPGQPTEPNRLAIMILGVVLSVAAGVGLAALVDGLDGTVRSRDDLEVMLAAVPLVSVPFVETFQDRRKLWIRRVSAAGAVAISLLLVFVWP